MDSNESHKTGVVYLLFTLFLFVFFQPQVSCATSDEGSWGENQLRVGSFYLSVKNGLLSLQAQSADLRKILQEISEKASIEIEIHPDISRLVTASFSDKSIEDALKSITDNLAMVSLKEKGKKHDRVLKAVIVPSFQTKPRTYSSTVAHSPPRPPPLPSKPVTSYIPKEITTTGKTTSKTEKRIPPNIAPNELVVKFKKGVAKDVIQNLIAETGATIKSHVRALNYYVLALPAHLSVDEALAWFRQQDVVDHTEPNYLIPLKDLPNDPNFSQQWALHNTGQTGGTTDADIDYVEAWDMEQGSEEVVIAVIDTGVDYTHEDLAGNIWQNTNEIPGNGIDDDNNGYIDDTIGWDFVDASAGASDEDFETLDNDPMDRHGHGTHVAGIAAAVSGNGLGIAGVAWNCRIMSVRAAYKTPSGDGLLESDDAAQALIYAAENGADIINLSWGDYQKSILIEDAVNYATNKGALICAAAGNQNSSDPIYPAAIDNDAVISVGATDSSDRKAPFSNYGDWMHVSAPGSNIYSTYLNDSYCSLSGTSMAAPHASGLAALLLSYYPVMSSLEVKSRIMRSVDVLPDLAKKNVTSGRINAYAAITIDNSAPYILSVKPDGVHENDRVTIIGDGFGDRQGSGVVRFYPNLEAAVISWSDSIIECSVPEGTRTGDLIVSTSAGDSNPVPVTILIRYYEETLLENGFLAGGQPQGWKADDQSWEYQLPFSFPLFGNEYDRVYVCSNGYLDFLSDTASYTNSIENLKTKVIIAPLWDDLVTHGSVQEAEDVYIHQPTADSICFRWIAERYESGDPVNVEVILYEDGRIKFNYGSGNDNISPTIGICGGDGNRYHFASIDGKSQLSEFKSILFAILDHTFTIPLDLGWNLISVPLVPKNQISKIFSEMNGGIESVWRYEDGAWSVYDPKNPEISGLQIIKPGQGYWLKTTQEGLNIKIIGQIGRLSLSLTNGWNLIGFNTQQRIPVEEAIAIIGEKVDRVWGYKDGDWIVYNSQIPMFSELDNVEPTRGYWIFRTNSNYNSIKE